MSNTPKPSAALQRSSLRTTSELPGPRLVKLGRKLPGLSVEERRHAAGGPDWIAANPRRIQGALALARELPTGGWFTLGASRRIHKALRRGPITRRVAGTEYVLWFDGETVRAAPNTCPHMGARLHEGRICDGKIVCPWHGMALGAEGRGGWQCAPVHDDGVLTWIALDEPGQVGSVAPVLSTRPQRFLDGVIELEAACTPDDILANRLDPWHGVHLHPYGFAELALTGEVYGEGEHRMLLRVAKRILGPLCVEVDISFHCASARCVVMTILNGEGAGSVVETHATPLGNVGGVERCAIVEATLATSDRPGFAYAGKIAGLIRPLIRRSAAQLWADDLPYAERLYELRTRGS